MMKKKKMKKRIILCVYICVYVFGCVQTAGKSDSNLIPFPICFLGLIVHTFFFQQVS